MSLTIHHEEKCPGVILREAKDLTRWAEILRFSQDDTAWLFDYSA